jgi:hypothetical protein
LSVIAHEMTCWECHGSGVVASEDAEPIPCPLCRDDYGRLKVVPASQLAGAVKAALDSADLLADAIFEGITQRTLESLASEYRAARQRAEGQ